MSEKIRFHKNIRWLLGINLIYNFLKLGIARELCLHKISSSQRPGIEQGEMVEKWFSISPLKKQLQNCLKQPQLRRPPVLNAGLMLYLRAMRFPVHNNLQTRIVWKILLKFKVFVLLPYGIGRKFIHLGKWAKST